MLVLQTTEPPDRPFTVGSTFTMIETLRTLNPSRVRRVQTGWRIAAVARDLELCLRHVCLEPTSRPEELL